jgi:hypothetical protein
VTKSARKTAANKAALASGSPSAAPSPSTK